MKPALSAFALLLPGAAFAAMTGDDLLRSCSAQIDSAEHRECASYIQGTIDASAATTRSFADDRAWDNRAPRLFCISKEEAGENVVTAVTRYLESHPENRASNAASNTLLALMSAYPCPKGPNAPDPAPDGRDVNRDAIPKR